MILGEGSRIIAERGMKGDREMEFSLGECKTEEDTFLISFHSAGPGSHYLPFRDTVIFTQPIRFPFLLMVL